ncbi:uncharacterized protein LOC127261086 isoform X4 [Andrographis paniculata]|uniref:uncharacterized protein LOC127261086 isoform X4 n=1 Tax=Andrographis paniculata TaxID=175694 RepID=UPI0021E95289|nr:uncharacterized protein LOC127261086 isoform X4 [Andrographis paniculata]
MNSLRRQPRSLHTATAGKKVSHALVNLVRVCRRKKRRTQRNLKSPMVLVEGGGFYHGCYSFEGHAQSTNDISSANTKVVHVKPIDRTFKDLVRHP